MSRSSTLPNAVGELLKALDAVLAGNQLSPVAAGFLAPYIAEVRYATMSEDEAHLWRDAERGGGGMEAEP